MSSALHSPIFVFYLKAVLGILAAAGVILAAVTLLPKRNIRPIWLTYRGWLIMAPLYLTCAALGRPVLVVLFTALSLLGLREFCRATGLYQDRALSRVSYAGVLAVAVLCLVPDPGQPGVSGWYGLFIVLPVYMIALILLVPIVRNQVMGQLQSIALSLIGFLYIGWMFGHLSFLTNSKYAMGYLLYLAFAVALNDVAAFVFGRLFGKHPLRRVISPNKTWEGALGAFAFSMVLPWVLRSSFPHFGAIELCLTGLIVGAGGQLGDLSMSVIKRDLGVKDMGDAIPGHGGVLDRLDSLVYVAPLFFHMARFFEGSEP